MVISLIGFSGCGKSHLARELVGQFGWRSICCDDLIEERIESELPAERLHGIRRVADWLGHPYDPGFAERQDIYFRAEQEVMSSVIPSLAAAAPDEHLVLDTTGSVIYVDSEVLRQIQALSHIVYLQIPPSDGQRMFEQYIAEPKPLIWRDVYQKRDDEDGEAALRRCYPLLIAERAKLYEQLADISVAASISDRNRLTPEFLLELLEIP
jgi:shikimate kinase